MAPRQRSISSPTPSEESFPDSSSDSSSSSSSQDRKLLNPPSRNASSTATIASTTTTSTLIRTEADVARDMHDYFNVVALGFIVFTIFLNYDIRSPSFAYTGEHFWTLWVCTAIYFVVDLLWVTVVPICVKSPHVIVKHHIAAMLYLLAPIYYPEYRWFMGGILSVEINTWFLIVRRLVYYRNSYGSTGDSTCSSASHPVVSPWVCAIISALFYVTWIIIRCYIYPRFLFIFWDLWVERVEQTGIYFHREMIFVPVHTALCILNLKWTYDLFLPIVTRWLGIGPKSAVVQSGL